MHQAINTAKEASVKLQIDFCRRFDHNHRAVYDMVRGGKVGIKISSRDPEPPPVSYVQVSGGIFYDMMIHDFDMARFLAGSEVTEVHTVGSVLVSAVSEFRAAMPGEWAQIWSSIPQKSRFVKSCESKPRDRGGYFLDRPFGHHQRCKRSTAV